jgi:hypothetical protein
MLIGQKLKELREAKKLSQGDVGKRRFEWPYVDPAICQDVPGSKRLKLCPRCSTAEKTCCTIVPTLLGASLMTQSADGFAERYYANRSFFNAGDYEKYEWVCKGSCDEKGKHKDTER